MSELNTLKELLVALRNTDQIKVIELADKLRAHVEEVGAENVIKNHMWPNATKFAALMWLQNLAVMPVNFHDRNRKNVRATLVNGPADSDTGAFLMNIHDRWFVAFGRDEEEALDAYVACKPVSKATFKGRVENIEPPDDLTGCINSDGEWHDLNGYTIERVVMTNVNMTFATTPDETL